MKVEHRRLSINQVTTREAWSFREAVEGYSRHGVRAMGVWHDAVAVVGVHEATTLLSDHGMKVSSYCLGGLTACVQGKEFRNRLGDNCRLVDEALALRADCIIFVAGGLPLRTKNLMAARQRAEVGFLDACRHAAGTDLVVALEPLHPMLCATRSCVTTLGQALDIIESLGSPANAGVAVDVYNVWWDPDLEKQIQRAGSRIAAFHVSDWLRETDDFRLDRGMMGEGVIDISRIGSLVEKAGYGGFVEVEIFSRRWWRRDPDDTVRQVKAWFDGFVQ